MYDCVPGIRLVAATSFYLFQIKPVKHGKKYYYLCRISIGAEDSKDRESGILSLLLKHSSQPNLVTDLNK